ncbi:MAG: 1-deoxy-D-xylulose-5-phosphate reductoisomerase [Pigmentiphaga sp.]|nr:1-deoxy-D-xylulose-5-phosphate reductoisomerase [Pigmentiphaga sp.]
MRHLTLLGATGSIGLSTLDVVARHPDRYRVYALTAQRRMPELATLAARHAAAVVVVPDDPARRRFEQAWNDLSTASPRPEIRVGAAALAETAADPECDTVMAAIVGAAGLPAALAAARSGKRVLLANKEALVAAGSLFMRAVRERGAELLPVDSEHNAIFQCLPHPGGARPGEGAPAGVRRLWLTASGGPFRTWQLDRLADVTPDQACAHPNWSMGRKISVDSATMLNKGLEVIEAHWLFAMPPDAIEVLIHPQSVVHSMVEYADGSVLAQLGEPDMRTPIAYGLAFPERIAAGVSPLELARIGQLDFEAPDLRRFPCLGLSMQALRTGQRACVALNAANEIAVEAFLAGRLKFTAIAQVIERLLSESDFCGGEAPASLDEVLALDHEARRRARGFAGLDQE